MILRTDKIFFSRLLVIGQSRKIDLWEILFLGTVSYPLASADGSLTKKTNQLLWIFWKPKGGDCLADKSSGTRSHSLPQHSSHSIRHTFRELTETMLQYTIKLALKHNCTLLDFVIDQYPENEY